MTPFETAPGLAGLRHGFFGRRGGISAPPYDSLNVGATTGDAPDAVAGNRRRIATTLEIDLARLVHCQQVHSNRVLTVSAPFSGELPEADGLVTREAGLAIAILTADCTPVLFADKEAGVIGAAHAGWRGACDGIAETTIDAMLSLGARRNAIRAAIGPTISGENYEVGPEFKQTVMDAHADAAEFFTSAGTGHPHFDLSGFVAHRLAAAGVSTIDRVGDCTYARPDRYFSHRYATHHATTTGRQLALITLG